MFQEFYTHKLAKPLADLEQRRRFLAKLAFGWSAPVFLIVFLALSGVDSNGLIVYVLLGLTAIGLAGWFFYARSEFRDSFKQQIVGEVVRFFSPELDYDPKNCVRRPHFEAGRIFRDRIDRYHGEDRVAGRLGQTDFEFSELHVEYKTTSSNKNGSQTSWHTIFRGLYFIADFNKDFHGHTVVLPDSLQRAFGFLGQSLQQLNFMRGELIKLEDPAFEKAFVVYGDDQVEDRYILTPAMMERMVELQRKIGGQVYFSFTGSQVHVAISSMKNHFEPRLFKTLLNVGAITEYYYDLHLVTGIIKDLNLNTRIWTKE